jgi:hypothetical protein
MVASDYVVSILATLMWNESHEDLILGMTLCGLVVRNRMVAGWEDGDWLRLIQKHDSYHFPTDKTPRAMKHGNPHHDMLFKRCLAVAENIYHGRERDITADPAGNGALWYGRLTACSEEFKEKIVRRMSDHNMIATIGRNACFR